MINPLWRKIKPELGILFLFLLFAQPVFAGNPVSIVVLGDSLTAGYRLPQEQAFPEQLEKLLKAEGYDVSVFNAGITGDTTAGGVMRAPMLIDKKPQLLIIELGANDMFRGADPVQVEQNLAKIIAAARQNNIRVLLAGMQASATMGEEYVNQFNGIYPRLAKQYGVSLYPFFMEGLMDYRTGQVQTGLLQPDFVHPNAEGVKTIVKRILPYVKDLIKTF